MKIAVDVGGVIFRTRDLESSADDELVTGVKEGLARLVADKHELWILSFCGVKTEARVRAALVRHGIDVWIPAERWLFVRKPTLKGPAMLAHGLTHLIDDLPENVARVQAIGLDATLFVDWAKI